jgi:hypothetical protein
VLGIGRGKCGPDLLALLRRQSFGFLFLLQPEACKLEPQAVGVSIFTAIWWPTRHCRSPVFQAPVLQPKETEVPARFTRQPP